MPEEAAAWQYRRLRAAMLPIADGVRFLYQLREAHDAFFTASAEGRGVAFFAHVGGFVFGWVVARALLDAGRIRPQAVPRRRSAFVPL